MVVAVHAEDVGVVVVVARQGANPVGRKELALVEHELEEAGELRRRHDGRQEALPTAGLVTDGDVLLELGVVLA